MSSENHTTESRELCESRSSQVERRMRHLWIPGRRRRLLVDSYDIGHASREIGASDLSEKNFRRAITLMHGRRPGRSNDSLKTFNVVAACHNLLGLQYLDEQRMTDAVASFDAAIELRSELRRLFPADRENEVYLGGALCNLGHAWKETNAKRAAEYYERSLAILRQPNQTCECSYWDEQRQSWWCSQLEALGQTLGLQWVALAPHFIDNASEGLKLLGSVRPS